jgi:ABC-2 type transport system ATP-binding protein
MLKQGLVVALDTTSNLLARFAGHTLTLRLAPAASLPAMLSARATQSESTWTFPLGNLGEIEPLLTAVREAGCVIDDLRLTQTDLEDVFLGVMQSSDRRKESAP